MKRVRVVVEATEGGSWRARCQEPGCTWTYGPALKTDAGDHARYHRQQHASERAA